MNEAIMEMLLPEWYRLSLRVSLRLPLRIALVAGLTPLTSLVAPAPIAIHAKYNTQPSGTTTTTIYIFHIND